MNLLDAINDPAELTILAFGSMPAPSLAASAELGATAANLRFVKPLDVDLLLRLARDHEQSAAVGLDTGGIAAAIRHLDVITELRLVVNAN